MDREWNVNRKAFASLHLCVLALIMSYPTAAQTVAVIAPDASGPAPEYATRLAEAFPSPIKSLDGSMSLAAYRAVAPAQPFNMTTHEAMNVGSAVGCDYFVIVKAATLRRTSFSKPEYYESWSATFAVSSRTGTLARWHLSKFEAATPAEAEAGLYSSAAATAAEIMKSVEAAAKGLVAVERPASSPLPPEGSAEAKGFRPPAPYRRIKPEYTSTAYMYDVTATVEVELDLGSDGSILRAEIVRWAGFGLDESSLSAVRSMNWRPAERNGKTLPIRVLLRYNFKKIDK